MLIGDLSIWNQAEHARKSRQLDLLARGDYSPILDELRRAYPRTDLPVRAIPFVSRYVAELSGMYARPVVRRFRAATLEQPVWQKLQSVYDASRIDRQLELAEADLWTQNVFLAVVLPDGIGKVRLHAFKPWQVEELQTCDAMRANDPTTWTRLVVTVPMQAVAGQVVMGRMVLTPTTASRTIGGQDVGIYAADKSHPFGRIPVVVAYRVAPDPGRSLPPVNDAVLNLQVALSLQQADNENIVRNCAFPQKWIKNANVSQLVEEISHGPDKFIAMVMGDPQAPAPELAIAQGQVPVAELVSFAEHQIRLYCAMLGLDPSSFLRVNTAVTAAARLFAAQDRQAMRDRILPLLTQLERDLLALITTVLSLREPMPFPSDLSLDVTWSPYTASPDPQAAAQALQAEVALGVSSPVDAVMARDGVGRAAALYTVKTNLDEARALGLIPAPAALSDGPQEAQAEGQPEADTTDTTGGN